MRVLRDIFIIVGLALLCFAAVFRFLLGHPYALLGVRALSLIALSNTAFLLAVLIKLFQKK